MLIRSAEKISRAGLLLAMGLFLLPACSVLPATTPVTATEPAEQPLAAELTEAYRAGLQLLQHDDARALDHWQQLADGWPEYPGVWVNLAIARYRSQDFSGSLESAGQALAIDSEFCPAFKIRGLAAREAGEFSLAEQSYLQALSCDPADANVHYNLGILYDLYLHDLQKALQQYQAAQQMQTEKDETLAMWIEDLQRRSAAQLAGEGS